MATEFARELLALKLATGRGYRDLARRTYVSAATLHRYCTGVAVPPEFTVARRLAKLHGLRPKEIDSLYRLWLRAQLESRPA